MSTLLVRLLETDAGARFAVRTAGLTSWTRRNFARWLFEDEPRGALLTPARWRRDFLARPGALDADRAAEPAIPRCGRDDARPAGLLGDGPH